MNRNKKQSGAKSRRKEETEMKSKYLTFDDRKRFESLHTAGVPLKVIAKTLGINLSTAYRELIRGGDGTINEQWRRVIPPK